MMKGLLNRMVCAESCETARSVWDLIENCLIENSLVVQYRDGIVRR